ncbi:MAG: GNAT family N-acetyltransferase [Anaerolineales bacterium]|nr:GNAT family N-acetyltransferase [Anaerolineales bacterium]
MKMPVLETERLRIRPFVETDYAAVLTTFEVTRNAATQQAWLRQWLHWNSINPEVLAKLYQPPYGDRAVELKAAGTVVGACGLVPSFGPFEQLEGGGPALNSPEIGLFYWFAPEACGQGYATEAAHALVRFAFETLRVKRIVATTEFDNAASQAVMRKLGMRLTRNPLPQPEWFQVVGILDNQ